MSKPRLTAQVIGELRHRVIQHNESLPKDTRPQDLMKLGRLKQLYKRWHGGRDPHQHALDMIDSHLNKMRDGLTRDGLARDGLARDGLAKSGSNGEPRDPDGKWTGRREAYRDVASRREHRQLADDNAGYAAAQTQVIPETRFSMFGPAAGYVVGVGAGAALGATASLDGSPADRAVTHGLRYLGGKAGTVAGFTAAVPIHGARHGIGAVNRVLHTKLPRPSAATAAAAESALRRGGRTAGRAIGGAAGRGQAIAFNAIPTGFRRIGETGALRLGYGPRMQNVTGRAFGAAVGAALATGAVPFLSNYYPAMGNSFASTARAVGPYLDTLFPRHVSKSVAAFLDSDEVLQKRYEVLNDPLQKAGLASVLRIIGNRSGRIARAVRAQIPIAREPPLDLPATPEGIGGAAARSTFQAEQPDFHVGRMRVARAGIMAGRSIAGAAAGAAAGAGLGIAGAAVGNLFRPEQHPRDEHGRFAEKSHKAAALLGAKIGGGIGLGAGILAGVLAARGAKTAVLRDRLDRIVTATPGLEAKARAETQRLHAEAYLDKNKNKVPNLAPGGGALHEQIKNVLEGQAVARWARREGAAIRAVDHSLWYKFQIDQAFDSAVLKALRGIPAVVRERDAAGKLVRDAAGKVKTVVKNTPLVLKSGRPATQSSINLADNLDPDAMNPGQRKLFEGMLKQRQTAYEGIDAQWENRRSAVKVLDTRLVELKERQKTLQREQDFVPERLQELDTDADASPASIRRFAQERMELTLKGRTRKELLDEIREKLPEWRDKSDDQLKTVEKEMEEVQEQVKNDRPKISNDLDESERLAVRNPFGTTEKERFLAGKPDYDTRKKQVEHEASKEFLRTSRQAENVAADHLRALLAATEQHLRARSPVDGYLVRQARHYAPVLVAHLQQAGRDYEELTTARRSSLGPRQKAIADWLAAHRNPTQAAATLKAFGAAGARHARTVGRFGMRHYGKITTVAAMATAAGILDMDQPKGKRLVMGRVKLPKSVDVVREFPNPLSSKEALFGISYRDKKGQERFLSGMHVLANGEHRHLPFGADVNQLRGQIRNRGNRDGGGHNQGQRGPRAESIDPDNADALKQTIQRMRETNAIEPVGPTGAQFSQRNGTRGNPGSAPKDVGDKFYNKHLRHIQNVKNQSTRYADAYYRSLKQLFEAPDSAVLSLEDRAHLIVGGGGRQRGIFANTNGVFVHPKAANYDEGKVYGELVRQIGVHVPQNDDEYGQLKRALFVAATHYDMPPNRVEQLYQALDQRYTRDTGREPSRRQESTAPWGPGTDIEQAHAFADEMLAEAPPPEERSSEVESDEDYRSSVAHSYRSHLNTIRNAQPGIRDDLAHERARERTRRDIPHALHKAWEQTTLRKFLRWGGQPTAPQPTASGAKPPRAPRSPSLGTEVHAKHVLGQAGYHLGGQAAYVAGQVAASVLAPKSGLLRLAGGMAGGILGGNRLQSAGEASGRSLGDTSQSDPYAPRSEGEAISRTGGMIGAQLATAHLYNKARGLEGGTGEVLGHAIRSKIGTTAVGQGIAGAARGAKQGVANAARGVGQGIAGAAERTGVTNAARSVGQGIAGAAERTGITGAAQRIGGSAVGRGVMGAAKTIASKVAPGFFQREGAAIGGAIGGVGGTVAGTVAEPGGGTVAGRIGGRLIGEGLGAGAGWLADEAIGAIYRHLGGSYGNHVAQRVARINGLKARKPSLGPTAPAGGAA